MRLKDGEFRKCPCIARAIEYLEGREKNKGNFFSLFFALSCHLILFFGRPCMLGHMLGDHLRSSPAYRGWRWRVRDIDRECGCVLENITLEELSAARLFQLALFGPPADVTSINDDPET